MRTMVIHNWMKMLLAILLGNVIYFVFLPFLADSLKHHLFTVDAGLLLDFAMCAGIYLLLRHRNW